jgi:hypothetical protein
MVQMRLHLPVYIWPTGRGKWEIFRFCGDEQSDRGQKAFIAELT